MRAFVWIVAGVAAPSPRDPCADLCARDGPAVCTAGSWVKPNGVCHAYVFRGEGYCYHTAATAAVCPATGRPVSGPDAERLLLAITETPSQSLQEGQSADALAESESDGALTETPPPSELERSLLVAQNLLGDALAEAVTSISERFGWIDDGERYIGQLVNLAMRDPSIARDIVMPVLRAALSVHVAVGAERSFANETGLERFCSAFADRICDAVWPLGAVVEPSIQSMFRMQASFFIARLPLYCPDVVNSLPARRAVLRMHVMQIVWTHRHWSGPVVDLAVNDSRAFQDAIPALLSDPRGLLQGTTRIHLNGDRSDGAMRNWLRAAGREMESESSWGRAAGRLIALAVASGSPLGVQLERDVCVRILAYTDTGELNLLRQGFNEILPVTELRRILPIDDFRLIIAGPSPEGAPNTDQMRTTVAPVDSAAAALAAAITDLAALPEAHVTLLAMRINVPLYRYMATRRVHSDPPIDRWNSVTGDALLRIASRSPDTAYSLAVAVFRLALNLGVPEGQEAEFAAAIGLDDFCEAFIDPIRSAILPFMQFVPEVYAGQDNSFLAELPIYCPEVLDTPFWTQLAISHQARRLRLLAAASVDHAAELEVTRESAFKDSVAFLTDDADVVATGLSRVGFLGEFAVGAGVIRDWFAEVARQIADPAGGLFALRSSELPSYVEFPSSVVENWEEQYLAVGRFLALAVLAGQPVGIAFPMAFVARLMNERIDLEDIEEDEPALFRSLSAVLSMSPSELTAADLELPLGGDFVPVTEKTRDSLVDERVNSLVPDFASARMAVIRSGFNDLFPLSVLGRIATPEDLRAAILGEPEIDVHDLMQHMQLQRYTLEDPQIAWLLNTLHEYSNEQRKMFLRFVTGTAQVPLGGFGFFPRITVDPGEDASALPTSSTCGFTLHLPRYASEQELREKMTIAITADAGMGIL